MAKFFNNREILHTKFGPTFSRWHLQEQAFLCVCIAADATIRTPIEFQVIANNLAYRNLEIMELLCHVCFVSITRDH